MKKFATAFLLMAAFAVYAGYDLALDERASYWNITPEQAGKTVPGEEFFSIALELSAGQTRTIAKSKLSYPVRLGDFLKVDTEIKGTGAAFVDAEILDITGNVIKTERLASAKPFADRFSDMDGKIRIRRYKNAIPARVRIIIGIEPGSCVVFDDIEAELDND